MLLYEIATSGINTTNWIPIVRLSSVRNQPSDGWIRMDNSMNVNNRWTDLNHSGELLSNKPQIKQ